MEREKKSHISLRVGSKESERRGADTDSTGTWPWGSLLYELLRCGISTSKPLLPTGPRILTGNPHPLTVLQDLGLIRISSPLPSCPKTESRSSPPTVAPASGFSHLSNISCLSLFSPLPQKVCFSLFIQKHLFVCRAEY